MTNTNDRELCSFTVWYASGSVVGPKEFDHALECDDCWKAMARWMDAEVVAIPNIEERAKRLAGAEEVIAAMVADDAATERARVAAAAVKLIDDRTTLADILSSKNDAELVRGPWKPRRKRTAKPKEKSTCDTTKTECSRSLAGEMPVPPTSETNDAVEDECRRWYPLLVGRWENSAAAAESAPAATMLAIDELTLQRGICTGLAPLPDGGTRFCVDCMEQFGTCPLLPRSSNKPVPAGFIDLGAIKEVPGEFTH